MHVNEVEVTLHKVCIRNYISAVTLSIDSGFDMISNTAVKLNVFATYRNVLFMFLAACGITWNFDFIHLA